MERCDVCDEDVASLVVCKGCRVLMCQKCVGDWHGTPDGDVCLEWMKETTEDE